MLLFDDQKRLTEAFKPEQAEILAHILEKQTEKQKQELATRQDLEQGLLGVRADMEHKLQALELRLTQRMFAAAGVIIAVLGFLIKF